MNHFCEAYQTMVCVCGRRTDFEYDWLRDELIELCQKAKEEGQGMPREAVILLETNIISILKMLEDPTRGRRRRNTIDGRAVSYVS